MITPTPPLASSSASLRARRGGDEHPATDAETGAIGDSVTGAIVDAVSTALVAGGVDERATHVAETIATASVNPAAVSALTAALIEGIVVGAGVDPLTGAETFDNTLLLKDGRAWAGLAGSPLALTPPPADGAYGAGWTHWRLSPENTEEREMLDPSSGVWQRLGGRLVEPNVDTPSNLSGNYSRSHTHVTGDTTATRHESLRLALDGTFARSGSVVATTAAPSLFGAGVPTVVHVPETATDPARLGGRYALLADGFTLELTYTDGSSERRLLLDEGGSRVLDGDRHRFFGTDIDAIDLLAIAENWAASRRSAKDWRAAVAEASARGVEKRALLDTHTPRPPATPRPQPPVPSPDRVG